MTITFTANLVNRRTIFILLVTLFGLDVAISTDGAETHKRRSRTPAARVLEVQGKVGIVAPSQPEREAAMFSVLYADDRLVLAPGAQATMIFRTDGHIERIATPGSFEIAAAGCSPKNSVEIVKLSEQNDAVAANISRGPTGIVAGGVVVARGPTDPSSSSDPLSSAGGAREVRPVAESTVLDAQPKFVWPADAKAKTYTVNLYDRGRLVWTDKSNTNHLAFHGDTPLKPGAMYTWEVLVDIDGEETRVFESTFSLASANQRAEFEGLAKLLVKPDVPRLALAAMWYKQHGFVLEAIAVHQQLAEISNDPAAYWALSGLYWQVGREDDAKATSKKAAELEKRSRVSVPKSAR